MIECKAFNFFSFAGAGQGVECCVMKRAHSFCLHHSIPPPRAPRGPPHALSDYDSPYEGVEKVVGF